ncbi:hypothetical protein G3O08_20505, partial [Cryomorpha ignava]|nr:hypothetical protein [Cryomorpha ignava]
AYYEKPALPLRVLPENDEVRVIVVYRIELKNGKVVQGWFTPDPAEQFSNPYLAMGNNPVMYVDPDGEFIFTIAALIAAPFTAGASLALLPYTIGADIGVWQGGSIANGTANPFQWDYSSGKTWGYMAGGAVVGAASGGAANAVANSGMAFANTAAIATGSFINSFGTALYTGGQTDVSISFGAASYNFTQNEWGYLGKKGNSTMENIGYGLGALTIASDYVDWKSAWNVKHRNPNDEIVNTKLGKKRNYLGPTKGSPYERFKAGVTPTDNLDWGAFYHDGIYYDNGANGFSGALLNKTVMQADLKLASTAISTIRNGSPIGGMLVGGAFYGIYGLKTAISYSYLYPYSWLNQ